MEFIVHCYAAFKVQIILKHENYIPSLQLKLYEKQYAYAVFITAILLPGLQRWNFLTNNKHSQKALQTITKMVISL
jgi:hypothetical protein